MFTHPCHHYDHREAREPLICHPCIFLEVKYLADFAYLKKKNDLFNFLTVVGLHRCTRLSPVAGSGGYSLVVVRGPLIAQASQCIGFSCCRVWAQQLWSIGSVAPWRGGSSLT